MKSSKVSSLALLLAVSTLSTLGIACAAPSDESVADQEGAVVTTSTNATRLIDAPFYFSVPKEAPDELLRSRA